MCTVVHVICTSLCQHASPVAVINCSYDILVPFCPFTFSSGGLLDGLVYFICGIMLMYTKKKKKKRKSVNLDFILQFYQFQYLRIRVPQPSPQIISQSA